MSQRTVFVESVLSRLPITALDKDILEGLVDQISRLENRGYTLADAVTTAKCWEEYSVFDEDTSLEIIARISARYPGK